MGQEDASAVGWELSVDVGPRVIRHLDRPCHVVEARASASDRAVARRSRSTALASDASAPGESGRPETASRARAAARSSSTAGKFSVGSTPSAMLRRPDNDQLWSNLRTRRRPIDQPVSRLANQLSSASMPHHRRLQHRSAPHRRDRGNVPRLRPLRTHARLRLGRRVPGTPRRHLRPNLVEPGIQQRVPPRPRVPLTRVTPTGCLPTLDAAGNTICGPAPARLSDHAAMIIDLPPAPTQTRT